MKCAFCGGPITTPYPTERDGEICKGCHDLGTAFLEALDGLEATVRRIRPHLPPPRKNTTPLSTASALITRALRSPALQKRLEEL